MRLYYLAAWAVILTPVIAACAQTAPLVDGNFSAPTPPPGGFALVNTGERYGSWRVVGETGEVAFINGAYVHNGYQFLSTGSTLALQQSGNWANLAGFSRSATGIMHAPVATVVGQSYTVNFWLGNIVDPGGIYGTTSTIKVYANAALVGTATNSGGIGTKTEHWQHFAVQFTATASWTVLAFIDGDGPSDMNCGLATVSFVQTTAAPTPPRTTAGLRKAMLP